MSEPSELPADIKPSKRTTKLMREQQNHRIIAYIQSGATDQAIMTGLKLTRRTFERRMKQIRQMHMDEVLDQQQVQAKASLLRLCQDKIRWLDMHAQKILMNPAEKTVDRMAAMDRSRQYQIDMAKLSIEGPTIFHVTPEANEREDGLYSRDQGAPTEFGNTPVLSSAATPSPSAATNDERQF
jgi:hypothetical protein